jgi:hypothetical protein
MISIHTLKKIHENKVQNQVKVYDEILKRMNQYILGRAEKGFQDAIYKIPPFIVGFPVFDFKKCLRFLLMKLYENGYKYQFMPPNGIFVSWKVNVIQEKIPESHRLESPDTVRQKGFDMLEFVHDGIVDALPVNTRYLNNDSSNMFEQFEEKQKKKTNKKASQLLLTFDD